MVKMVTVILVFMNTISKTWFTPTIQLSAIGIRKRQKLAKLQDIQFHPVSEAIIHADFMEVSPYVPLTIAIPVNVTGNAPGVRAGGKIMVKIRILVGQKVSLKIFLTLLKLT